ncbi:MAG: transcription elongation factor GreA [Candidatus Pacebacteria bacterium]|jgi:transcription elongation factor GreA|nr:transcription elongation factor GreA [Candidatus Paceibacterota bacterium]MDD5013323.1 transcription elongation factor GreA [Candidatus Paceibacterota bacterium]MDD5752714.1 transcription elongation factor GreA [Candidatus Paceibacterota bacterium]
MEDKYITKEGLEKLKKELERLKKEERIKIANELKEAISFGDLSENAAYDEAKENQAFIEGKIAELEKLISSAKIIKKQDNNGWVQVGSRVTLTDGKTEETYEIVGEEEANPLEKRLSFKSPLGHALLNKPQGAQVEINTAKGTTKYKVLKIA